MKFEDLIDKPLHKLSDEDIERIVKELSFDQLEKFEQKVKKKMRSKPVSTKKKKQREDEFTKALLS